MYEIDAKLEELESKHCPIQVGLIGVGQMGKEIVCQVGLMKGMRIAVAVDLDVSFCLKAFEAAGYRDNR